MELRKKTTMIVIHCAATKTSMDIGATEIKKWHVDDNGWDDIGYHYIIKRGGLVEVGRPEGFQGAHAPAANSKSIGVCLIGGMADDGGPENNFTLEQFLSLKIFTALSISSYVVIPVEIKVCLPSAAIINKSSL